MKVRVLEGKGPIHGRWGLQQDNEVFTTDAVEGKQLIEAELVEEVGDDEDAKPEPKQGFDMKRSNQKENKGAANRQTKEEK